MAKIEKAVTISRKPDEVWAVVGDFGAISSWMPAIETSSFKEGTRSCTMAGGGELTEEILSRDDNGRQYEYRITNSPMPIEHHHSSIKVDSEGDGSRITWITEITPDDLAPGMDPIFDDALRSLKDHLERRA